MTHMGLWVSEASMGLPRRSFLAPRNDAIRTKKAKAVKSASFAYIHFTASLRGSTPAVLTWQSRWNTDTLIGFAMLHSTASLRGTQCRGNPVEANTRSLILPYLFLKVSLPTFFSKNNIKYIALPSLPFLGKFLCLLSFQRK